MRQGNQPRSKNQARVPEVAHGGPNFWRQTHGAEQDPTGEQRTADRYVLYQQCGGGRRIIRKKIRGGD